MTANEGQFVCRSHVAGERATVVRFSMTPMARPIRAV
jgi:hypothetical protein